MQESLIDGLSAMVGGDLRMPKMAMSKTNWWIGLVCQRILACEHLHVCAPGIHTFFVSHSSTLPNPNCQLIVGYVMVHVVFK